MSKLTLEEHVCVSVTGETVTRKHWQIMKQIDGKSVRVGYVGKSPGSPIAIIRNDLVESADRQEIAKLCKEQDGKDHKISEYRPMKKETADLKDYE